MSVGRDREVQLSLAREGDEMLLKCFSLAGQEVLCFRALGSNLALDVCKRFARKLSVGFEHFRVVLPDGQLFSPICKSNDESCRHDSTWHKYMRYSNYTCSSYLCFGMVRELCRAIACERKKKEASSMW